MTRYYFCTAVNTTTDVIDARYPTLNDAITTCCSQFAGTIGVSTVTNSSITPGDAAISMGTMGCGWPAPDVPGDSMASDPATNWWSCILTAGTDITQSCIESDAGSLVSAQPFQSGMVSSSGTMSSGSATSSMGASSTLRPASATSTKSFAVSSSIGVGSAAFLLASVALTILRAV